MTLAKSNFASVGTHLVRTEAADVAADPAFSAALHRHIEMHRGTVNTASTIEDQVAQDTLRTTAAEIHYARSWRPTSDPRYATVVTAFGQEATHVSMMATIEWVHRASRSLFVAEVVDFSGRIEAVGGYFTDKGREGDVRSMLRDEVLINAHATTYTDRRGRREGRLSLDGIYHADSYEYLESCFDAIDLAQKRLASAPHDRITQKAGNAVAKARVACEDAAFDWERSRMPR